MADRDWTLRFADRCLLREEGGDGAMPASARAPGSRMGHVDPESRPAGCPGGCTEGALT